LADNEAWEALEELARQNGESELALRFAEARATEDEHLENVRTWLRIAQDRPE
jgi:hypothetical protein